MIINFFHPCLQPSIECSTIATEGYEIQNLVSSDPLHLHKGFLAERFIAGPVNIIIKLIGPINIKHIVIWSKVCNQKSLGFELSSRKNSNDKNDFKRFACSLIRNNADGILFHQEGNDVAKTHPDISLFHKNSFFRGKGHENVTQLIIKIFKFQYVAAIKKIEILGEPSATCDRQLKKEIYNSWFRMHREHSYQPHFFKDVSEPKVMNTEVDSLFDSVPEEFCDEITHEIMTLPMILPSGNIVDYQTLEKHEKEEGNWGRPPSDPFTGVRFTNNNKPIVATILKSRINIFLLQHSEENFVRTLPRRLGGENASDVNFQVSKILDDNSRKRKRNPSDEGSSSEEKNTSEYLQSHKPNEPSMKKSENGSGLNLRSYLERPKPVKMNVTCTGCSGINNLYKLPCMHTICRTCIVKNENKCKNCQINFTFADIQKIHVLNVY